MLDFFTRLLKREPPAPAPKENSISAVNIPTAQFSSWTGDAYNNDIYRAAVDAIARNAAKLKAVHVITRNGEKQAAENQHLQKLLQISPNPYMTSYDLLYKMTTQYFLYNNAFALLDFNDGGRLAGVYPINFSSVNFAMDGAGNLFTEFTFRNGRKAQFNYSDILHIRRHFNGNEFLGDDNRALNPALEIAHTQNEGLVQSIKNGANLRGILKLSQIAKADNAKEIRKNFIKDYLDISNNGGVAILDTSTDYLPLNNQAAQIDNGQISATKEKIYSYLGISEKIVSSSYSEDEYAAFYESTIEPLAVQLSLEFTRKIFSDREKAFGNQIIFESGRLQFTSNKTKIELLKELLPLGLLSINQALEILNLPPIEGGDQKRLQTLNVVDFDKAAEYQLTKAGKKYGDKASANNGVRDNAENES